MRSLLFFLFQSWNAGELYKSRYPQLRSNLPSPYSTLDTEPALTEEFSILPTESTSIMGLV
jgi:hypothetical protein